MRERDINNTGGGRAYFTNIITTIPDTTHTPYTHLRKARPGLFLSLGLYFKKWNPLTQGSNNTHTHILIKYMDYALLKKTHAQRHAQLCQSDVLFGLLYGGDNEALISHVKGLIDAEDTPKPGQLTLMLSPVTEWSAELRDAMALLRTLEDHPILGQPEQAGLRHITYSANPNPNPNHNPNH